MFPFSKKWDPRGKHCFLTGASSGTGLCLALLLVKTGAHVSIVARNEKRLTDALAELEKARRSAEQNINCYVLATNSEAGTAAVIKTASEPFKGRCPDAFFLCAGCARPGFFVEQDEETLRAGMENTYYAQAFSALAAAKEMVKQGVKGKIIFVSSVLAYFSVVGYASYAPGKHALRGLAESLHSEFKLYGIDVHIAFPATIYTRSYEEENKTKPSITLKIEESDTGVSPDVIAAGILDGVRKGKFHITIGFVGDLFRASTAGSSPRNSFVLDLVYGLIGYIALATWRQGVDKEVVGHRDKHHEYLQEQGFLARR